MYHFFCCLSLINLIFLILFWEVELNRVLKLLCWFSSEVIITDCWLLYVRVVCVVKVADNRCAVHETCSAGGRAGARFTSDLRTVAALLHGWLWNNRLDTNLCHWMMKQELQPFDHSDKRNVFSSFLRAPLTTAQLLCLGAAWPWPLTSAASNA